MNNAIVVNQLKKSYGNHLVLKEISFQIAKGEIFAFLGINGAGKTTTLECLEGLKSYENGTITINGSVGIQLQSSSLPSHIKPLEALELFARWNHVAVNNDLIQQLQIDSFKNQTYVQCSTGQKRRLHLALALMSNPDILFLDEPTAGLDVEGRIALHEYIRQLKSLGKTIVLASHDMAEVEALCDRIAILNEGEIVFCGTADELTKTMGRKYVIRMKTEYGNDSIEADNIEEVLLALLQELKQNGIKVLDIQVDRGTLEQHFMSMARRNK